MQNPHKKNQEKMLVACPFCKSSFDINLAETIESERGNLLLYRECKACNGSVFVFVVATQLGINAMSFVTDLNKDDFNKFRKSEPISLDKVIDFKENIDNLSKFH